MHPHIPRQGTTAHTARSCNTLPTHAQYRDLSPTSQLAVTLHAAAPDGQPPVVLGGATLPLFSAKGRLKTGRQQLRLTRGCLADPRWPSTTPGKDPCSSQAPMGCVLCISLRRLRSWCCEWCQRVATGKKPYRRRLEVLLKRHQRGEMPHLQWLDTLAMGEILARRAKVG